MFSSHSSFKCGRFSTEKLVSNRQCPVRSVCVAHITQALVTAAFLAGSVLWSGFLSPLGTCPASPMKRPSLSVSEKGNKGCWLICFKTLALWEEMASPVYFLFPFCKTGRGRKVHHYSESSEQHCSRVRRGLCGQSGLLLQCYSTVYSYAF